MLTVLLRPLLPGVTCGTTPPVLAGEPLLRQSTSFVTSVILRRDCIPRAAIQSGRRMLSQLASTRAGTGDGKHVPIGEVGGGRWEGRRGESRMHGR